MPLAEGSAKRFAYKFYSSGAMTQNAEALTATDPGAASAKTIRRTEVSLGLRKNVATNPEILASRQRRSSRHTSRWIDGDISGILSPGTYCDLIEAALRGTGAAILAAPVTQTTLTTVTADNTTSTFTFTGGDPVVAGMTKGAIIQFSGLTPTANNSIRFMIVGFSGASNRIVQVYPAPTTMTSNSTFSISTSGKSGIIPGSGHVRRRIAVEDYDSDLALARLYTEARITGFSLGLSPDNNATFKASLMGRSRKNFTGGSAPYFTSPAAATTTEAANGLNGAVFLGTTAQGIITGLNFNLAMAADAPRVVGQGFVPDILLGTALINGDFTALADDTAAFAAAFENETESELLIMLTAGTSTADAISLYLPRVKINAADQPATGEGAQMVNCQFEALEYTGSGTGTVASTFRYTDTAWA